MQLTCCGIAPFAAPLYGPGVLLKHMLLPLDYLLGSSFDPIFAHVLCSTRCFVNVWPCSPSLNCNCLTHLTRRRMDRPTNQHLPHAPVLSVCPATAAMSTHRR